MTTATTIRRAGLGYSIHGIKFYVEGMNPSFFDLASHAIALTPPGFLGLGANYNSVHKEGLDSNIFLKQGYVEFGQQLVKGLM
jgi:hypothetical protein